MKRETPNENGKLNNILIKTIRYNLHVGMWKTSIFSDLSAPTEIRDPTLLLDPASVLLDPTKRGLRNPTLRVCKTQLAKKNEEYCHYHCISIYLIIISN